MPLLHPGAMFPELILTVPGGQEIPVPGSFAGEFGVVLFNRGAWCGYGRMTGLHAAAAIVTDGWRSGVLVGRSPRQQGVRRLSGAVEQVPKPA
jgi:hypothetical protein